MRTKSTIHVKSNALLHGYIVEKTAKRMKQSFARILSDSNAGITVDQWILLEQLAQEDKVSQLELAKSVYKDAPTVTRIIDLLSKKNLVDRVMDDRDRRRFKLVMTSEGKSKYRKVNKLAIAFRKQLYEGLADEEIERLSYILNKINSNLGN